MRKKEDAIANKYVCLCGFITIRIRITKNKENIPQHYRVQHLYEKQLTHTHTHIFDYYSYQTWLAQSSKRKMKK